MNGVYLAGPMRGIPDFNFPMFHTVAAKLRKAGFGPVFNPAEHDEQKFGKGTFVSRSGNEADLTVPFSIREALRDDLCWIAEHADMMVLLPGWNKSRGAIAEYALAKALGLSVWTVSPELDSITKLNKDLTIL